MKKASNKNKPTINTPNPQKSSPQLQDSSIKLSKKANNRYTSINLFSSRIPNNNPDLNSPTLFVDKTNLVQTPNTSKIFFLKNRFSNLTNQMSNPLINMIDSSFKENINPNRLDNEQCLSESNLIIKGLPPKTIPTTTSTTPKEPFILSSFQSPQHPYIASKSIFNGTSRLNNEIKARLDITPEEAKSEQLNVNNQRGLIRTNSLFKLHVNSPKMNGYHIGKALSIGSMESLKSYPNSHTKLNNTSNIMEHHFNVMNDSNGQISNKKSNGSSERATVDGVDIQERCINHHHKKVFNILIIFYKFYDRQNMLK